MATDATLDQILKHRVTENAEKEEDKLAWKRKKECRSAPLLCELCASVFQFFSALQHAMGICRGIQRMLRALNSEKQPHRENRPPRVRPRPDTHEKTSR